MCHQIGPVVRGDIGEYGVAEEVANLVPLWSNYGRIIPNIVPSVSEFNSHALRALWQI